MAHTASSAFLQLQVSRLAMRAGPAMRLLPGTRAGAWRVGSVCRSTPTTATHPAEHVHTGERVALTVFDTPALALSSYIQRILARAQVVATIEHPGVIDFFDAGMLADGRPYVVTELVEGITLAERANHGQLEPDAAITILRGICAPLVAAHAAGVVHGTLDLERVLLVEGDDRNIKLLDWGIERAVTDEVRRAGIDLETPIRCVAPEEAHGLASPQTDAYALGVVAYQLLLGRPPFEVHDVAALRAVQQRQVEPRELWPAIPSVLETLLIELLSPDPRVRPTLHQVGERLATVQRELTVSSALAQRDRALDSQPVVVDEPPDLRSFAPRWRSTVAAAAVVCTATC